VFLLGGLALEALHGMKAGFYLDPANETRRLLFRLAHAHGTLIALVNVVYGLTVRAEPRAAAGLASPALLAALLLVPGGFFAGGFAIHGGDPGLGVLLVPAGALALAVGVALVARAVSKEEAP
jgi:hypothetical protein